MNTVEQMRSMTDEERKLHEEGLNRLFKPTGRNLHDLGSVEQIDKTRLLEWLEESINDEFWKGDYAEEAFRAVRNIILSGAFDVKEESCDSITK